MCEIPSNSKSIFDMGTVIPIVMEFPGAFSYTILSGVYVLIGLVLFLLRDKLGVVG